MRWRQLGERQSRRRCSGWWPRGPRAAQQAGRDAASHWEEAAKTKAKEPSETSFSLSASQNPKTPTNFVLNLNVNYNNFNCFIKVLTNHLFGALLINNFYCRK